MTAAGVDALDALIQAIAAQPEVRAIGLSGSEAALLRSGEGDIDLLIYCREVPPDASRRRAVEGLGDLAQGLVLGQPEGGPWGVADSLRLTGVETWLMHFDVEQAEADLEGVLRGDCLERSTCEYYPIGRCAALATLRPLYDPDGLLARLRECLAAYPPGLAQAFLSHHLSELADSEDLDRAVTRGDLLFYHYALDVALDRFLLALFALNRTYFPSRKRTPAFVEEFRLKPADCTARLLRAVELGAQVETLAESRAMWLALVRELRELADATRPQPAAASRVDGRPSARPAST